MTDYQKRADEHASKMIFDLCVLITKKAISRNMNWVDLSNLSGVPADRIMTMFESPGLTTLTEMQSIAVALGYRIDSLTIKRLDAPREG